MTLKWRFFLVFTGFILLVLGIYSATYYLIEERTEVAEQRQYARSALEKVAAACREAYLGGDWVAALSQMRVLKREPEVAFSDCLDLKGRVRTHTDPQRIGLVLAPAPPAPGKIAETEYAGAQGRRLLEISAPIVLSNQVLGVARIGYDLIYLRQKIQKRLFGTLRRMGTVSLITLVLAALAALLVASGLIRPIQELVHATREVKEGHLDYQSPAVRRKDELGHLAQAFNEMSQHLAELDKMKKQFVDSITHDLKAPITVIQGYLEIFIKFYGKSFSAAQIQQLQIADAACRRLSEYVNNILDFSKLQVGKLPMTLESVSLGEIARSIAEAYALACELSGVRVEAEVEEGLPPVGADAEMIHRVISNLVSNSLKFTPKGGRVAIEVAGAEPGFLRVAVRDTGAGIPPEDLPRVFERFYQVEKTRGKARGSGTGLGLTISRQIVEQHGGRMWVESREGAGTVFYFTLPLRASAEIELPGRTGESPSRAQERSSS